jgi:uncharacterized protein (TIGR02246 family)
MNHFKLATVCVALSGLVISCNNEAADKAGTDAKTTEVAAAPMEAAKPDKAKLKAEIQALESSWAVADNARDTNAVAAFYSDDAVSMGNNRPMLVGKDAIRKDVAAGLAKKTKGATVAYDVIDVFGDENTVTETGKITTKDASGKVVYTGKYMAVWEKRNGKFICIRDISNDDVKEK